MSKTYTVSIIGAGGYTGMELVRILLCHPQIQIGHLYSATQSNQVISDSIPHLSHLNLKYTSADIEAVANESDCVFLAMPHGKSIEYVKQLYGKTRIIDLSADFRLQDANLHQKYYQDVEFGTEYRQKFVYGFIARNYDSIKNANYIANPGCFALCSQLALLPFADSAKNIDIFAITGSSGAGKTLTTGTHHPVRSHNLFSYNINSHRHIGEILQSYPYLQENINFVPSSGPFVRGIFLNAFITCDYTADIEKCFIDAYKFEKFTRRQNKVELANVQGSNFFDYAFTVTKNGIIIQAAIDNLVKGASGNAVECMNIMLGLDQTAGLSNINTIYP